MPDGGMRQLEGGAPLAIREELATVCGSFNDRVDVLGGVGAASVIDLARAAAGLYAGILRVHPFVDGNHRVGFVALSAALWSFGLPNVELEEDEEMTGHDESLVTALLSKHGSVESFARSLADLIEDSTGRPT